VRIGVVRIGVRIGVGENWVELGSDHGERLTNMDLC